jgi:hypothetical protein
MQGVPRRSLHKPAHIVVLTTHPFGASTDDLLIQLSAVDPQIVEHFSSVYALVLEELNTIESDELKALVLGDKCTFQHTKKRHTTDIGYF